MTEQLFFSLTLNQSCSLESADGCVSKLGNSSNLQETIDIFTLHPKDRPWTFWYCRPNTCFFWQIQVLEIVLVMWIRQGNGENCDELQFAKTIAQAISWASIGVGSSVLDPFKMRHDGRRVWNDHQMRGFLLFHSSIVSSTSFWVIGMICVLWIKYILLHIHHVWTV